jgi:UDPglucose 6-dehydrogenase
VGTADALQRGAARRFVVASNPEFLREGRAIADSLCPDRIVAGGSPDAESLVVGLYEPIIAQQFAAFGTVSPLARRPKFHWMERRSAELTKYAANAFLATKLSFVNEMANVAAALDADIRAVLEALAADPRIGASYMRPGIGWGGSCFPKDTRALSSFALESGYDFRVLRAVIEQNNDQVRRFFEMIRAAITHSDHVKIALLGLAFKAGTADCRESPAVAVARLIQDQGWALTAFDPAIRAGSPSAPEKIAIASSAEDAVVDADAIVVATEWPQFQDLDFQKLRKLTRGNLLFDGRCIIEPRVASAAGFQYHGICGGSDRLAD